MTCCCVFVTLINDYNPECALRVPASALQIGQHWSTSKWLLHEVQCNTLPDIQLLLHTALQLLFWSFLDLVSGLALLASCPCRHKHHCSRHAAVHVTGCGAAAIPPVDAKCLLPLS